MKNELYKPAGKRGMREDKKWSNFRLFSALGVTKPFAKAIVTPSPHRRHRAAILTRTSLGLVYTETEWR